MKDFMPGSRTIYSEQGQEILDVVQLAANTKRETSRMIIVVSNEPVGEIEQRQRFTSYQHAPCDMTNDYLQKPPRAFGKLNNLTKSELQAPDSLGFHREAIVFELEPYELTIV